MIRLFLLATMVVAAVSACGRSEPPERQTDPRVAALVRAVSASRLQQTVATLAAFGTRNTLSDATAPDRGIGAAREWILRELQRASPRLQVSFDVHHLAQQGRITRPVELRNVIAVLPGRSARRIYVTAHYDSVTIGPGAQIASNTQPPGVTVPDAQLNPAQDYNALAPGANDNGSGTALTMELARVLAGSGIDFDATLVFALWAGEEQGLFGSRAHAQRLQESGAFVEATFNNDIVGNSRGGNGVVDTATVRLYAQGPEDSMSRSLARYIENAAAAYVPSHRVRLMAREDRFSRSSDHTSFTQRGFPAVVSERGQPLIGRQPSGYDANLRWLASPGASSYRVYRRDPWSQAWESSEAVGNVTQYVVQGASIDDWVFGVAAVGPGGQESLISAWVPRSRADAEIKFQAR
jgi:hypothetical protein